ncbi:RodZ domain-containing protein [Pseudoalteromonas sp. T1lg23B]|uniref:RodZ domain-containing protein n=1 Tax=Pseudoalteromonas sp. T1lg23B TaxID=2077097 RepID=UPI000CF6F7C2|nr:RodZ domain-containing protein [Pseudoalteromonas sp. T1lg23B]
MKQENIEMEEQTPTTGQSLHTARVAAGLSIEDVSARLKLTALQITKLEQDDYQDLGPMTFVRGYIRSYCGVLELDVEKTLALMDAPKAPEATKRMQSFSRRTEKEASDNRLMIFSYLILALVIGSSGVWVWQTSNSTVENSPAEPKAALTNADSTSVVPATEDKAATSDTQSATVQDSDGQKITAESENTAIQNDTIPNLEEETLSDEAVNVHTSEQNVSQGVTENKDASLSTIVMRFNDDSWVEIFDATEERIAFGVKKAGYTMTVDGKAPFSVVLGKHQAVDVELDGQLVDLSALPRNRLAKFKLPLAE